MKRRQIYSADRCEDAAVDLEFPERFQGSKQAVQWKSRSQGSSGRFQTRKEANSLVMAAGGEEDAFLPPCSLAARSLFPPLPQATSLYGRTAI
jgi:hypothetical protein